jgi:hypothetical protein
MKGARLLPVAALLAGCQTAVVKPDYLAPGFEAGRVEALTVLPAVDLRKDRSFPIPGEKLQELMLYKELPASLKKSGYADVVMSPARGAAPSIDNDDLEEANADWVKSLGPDAARWVLLVTLDDFVSRSTFGVAVNAKCTGYLFDKTAGALAWRHKASASEELGGALGLMWKGKGEDGALVQCPLLLMQQFPRREMAAGDAGRAATRSAAIAPAATTALPMQPALDPDIEGHPCREDRKRVCPDARRGAHANACLRAHEEQLSEGCRVRLRQKASR